MPRKKRSEKTTVMELKAECARLRGQIADTERQLISLKRWVADEMKRLGLDSTDFKDVVEQDFRLIKGGKK